MVCSFQKCYCLNLSQKAAKNEEVNHFYFIFACVQYELMHYIVFGLACPILILSCSISSFTVIYKEIFFFSQYQCWTKNLSKFTFWPYSVFEIDNQDLFPHTNFLHNLPVLCVWSGKVKGPLTLSCCRESSIRDFFLPSKPPGGGRLSGEVYIVPSRLSPENWPDSCFFFFHRRLTKLVSGRALGGQAASESYSFYLLMRNLFRICSLRQNYCMRGKKMKPRIIKYKSGEIKMANWSEIVKTIQRLLKSTFQWGQGALQDLVISPCLTKFLCEWQEYHADPRTHHCDPYKKDDFCLHMWCAMLFTPEPSATILSLP